MPRRVVVGLNAVILAVTDDEPRVLVVRRPTARDALPFGPLDPDAHRTLELGLRRWVREQTGLELGYVEQLYTFGDRDREKQGEDRVLSIGYLALVHEEKGENRARGEARWRDLYPTLPWEDRRKGVPSFVEDRLLPTLQAWVAEDEALRTQRRERVDIAFGLRGSPWDAYRALDRYELLWEAGLVAESSAGAPLAGEEMGKEGFGQSMAEDHRRILATALSRIRGKLKYRPVVFEVLPEQFTLLELQRVVEALAGVPLHKQNFRRLVERAGLVEETGEIERETGGRPAARFRFRREVLRERPTPGVGLPGARRRG